MADQIEKVVDGTTIRLVPADLTERDVDAIVNAANSGLQHGGGVAGAIVEGAARSSRTRAIKSDMCPWAALQSRPGGKLKARYVIHAVGPRMGEGDEDNKLKNAIKSVLKLASEERLKSISIPAISAGIFGFPKDRCAKILVSEVSVFLRSNPSASLKLVELCIFDRETFGYFKNEMEKL